MRSITLVILGGLLSLPFVRVEAATLLVPSQYPTIGAAVAAAHNGDTIRISPNTTGDGTYHEIITLNRNTLTVIGEFGATLDGSGTGTSDGHGNSGIVVNGSSVSITSLTVRNYNFNRIAGVGGTFGIELYGSNDFVTSCSLSGN